MPWPCTISRVNASIKAPWSFANLVLLRLSVAASRRCATVDPVPPPGNFRIRCSLIGLLKHYTRTNCRHSPMHLHLGLHQPPLLFNRIRLRAGRARGHHVSPSPPHGNGRLAPGAIHSHGTLLATWVQNGSVNTSTLPLSALVCDPPPRFVPW